MVLIHGSLGREDRIKAQEAFRHDPHVQVLLATDAAGEGINLQRAHLMVNYDLPWKPQPIGAAVRPDSPHRPDGSVPPLEPRPRMKTREGDVYSKLLNKLEQAREALGGQVFRTCSAKLHFPGPVPARTAGRGDPLR